MSFAYGNVKALRPFEYHLPHINLTLTVLLERLIVYIDLLSLYFSWFMRLWTGVLPWRDMLFAVPLACVLNSWSYRYKPLLNPTQPLLHPSEPVCVCVCVCEEDLATKRAEQWQLGRMTSEQVDISTSHRTCIQQSHFRLFGACRGTRLTFSAYYHGKCNNNMKWLSQHYGKDISEKPFSSHQHKPCKGCIASSERP